MDVERLGKRIVVALEGDLFIVLHLMIAGRLHWRAPGAKGGGKSALAELAFRVARSR
jgi:formamidopyrimidine-DNA glycosylase